MAPRLIVVVCRGNMHRSVVAEACIKKIIQEHSLESGYQVVSRGIQNNASWLGGGL